MTKSELRKNIIQILQLAVQGNGLCELTPALKKSNVSNIAICALCPGQKDCACLDVDIEPVTEQNTKDRKLNYLSTYTDEEILEALI